MPGRQSVVDGVASVFEIPQVLVSGDVVALNLSLLPFTTSGVSVTRASFLSYTCFRVRKGCEQGMPTLLATLQQSDSSRSMSSAATIIFPFSIDYLVLTLICVTDSA